MVWTLCPGRYSFGGQCGLCRCYKQLGGTGGAYLRPPVSVDNGDSYIFSFVDPDHIWRRAVDPCTELEGSVEVLEAGSVSSMFGP